MQSRIAYIVANHISWPSPCRTQGRAPTARYAPPYLSVSRQPNNSGISQNRAQHGSTDFIFPKSVLKTSRHGHHRRRTQGEYHPPTLRRRRCPISLHRTQQRLRTIPSLLPRGNHCDAKQQIFELDRDVSPRERPHPLVLILSKTPGVCRPSIRLREQEQWQVTLYKNRSLFQHRNTAF